MVNLIEKGFLDKEEIKNIHLGTISPGEIRGNHFHDKQKEWLFVFGGKARVAARAKKGGKVTEEFFSHDDKVLEIDPGEAHAVQNIDDHEIYVCAYSNNLFDRDDYNDNIKDEII